MEAKVGSQIPMTREQMLEVYKRQNPAKYQKKFIDAIEPAPMEITPSRLQSKEQIEAVQKKSQEKQEAEIEKRIKLEVDKRLAEMNKDKENENSSRVPTEHRKDNSKVQDNG